MPFLGSKRSLIHMMRYVSSKYGPVSGIYLGKQPAVIITDFNILKGSGLNRLLANFCQHH
jgi:hypothetical protein